MKTFSFFFTTSLLLLFVVSLRVTTAAEGSEGTTFVATEPRHHNAHHKHSTALGSGDTNHGIQSPHTARHYERARRLLRSGRCEHVYLDLGSNIGIQIRKLYEPQYYPRARFLQVFNEKFGIVANTSKSAADLAARSNVCAFGFEPNPHFTHRLSAIEEAYTNIGFPIVMFTETAIGVTPANVSFFLEPTVLPKVHEWGASMLNWHGNMTQITAGSVVLSDFILHSIKNRKGNVTFVLLNSL